MCSCAGTLPPVQKAVFTLLPSLGPTQLPQLWPDLLQLLLNLLRPQALEALSSAVEQQQQHTVGAGSPPKSSNVNRHALSALSMEAAVDILSQLYRSRSLCEMYCTSHTIQAAACLLVSTSSLLHVLGLGLF